MPRLATLRPVATASKAARQGSSRAGVEGKAGDKLVVSPHCPPRAIVTAPLQMGAPVAQASSQLQVAAGGNYQAKQVRGDVGGDALRSRLFSSREVRDNTERAQYMSSSGSEHEPSSVCLAAMVHEFMQEDGVAKVATQCGRPRCNCENGVCDGLSSISETDDTKSVIGKELNDMLQGLAPSVSPLERSLLLDTTQVVAKVKEGASLICKDGDDTCTSCLRRLVMGELRRRGYNAAICKARWDHAGGYPGGDYEYIDVLVEGVKEERLLVDIDFRAQFEIARPTNSYQALLNALPSIFAGKADRIHQLVKIMSDGARRSLKKRGLYLPPWRKPEYMRAKWLSAYRRTTNPVPPEHLAVDNNLNRDVGSLAVRAHGWDERFRSAMESHYQRLDTAPQQQAVEENFEINFQDQMLQRKPVGSALTAQFKAISAAQVAAAAGPGVQGSEVHRKSSGIQEGDQRSRQVLAAAAKEAELEGRVRGANKMLFTRAINDPMASDLGTELRIRDNNDWKLPALKPRSPHRTKMVTGLASMLNKSRQQHQEQNPATRTLVAAV